MAEDERDLDAIRWQLERLVERRLLGGLSLEEEHQWLRLVVREVEMLGLAPATSSV